MNPSEVKTGMELTYKELKVIVLAPYLNFVLIELPNKKQVKRIIRNYPFKN